MMKKIQILLLVGVGLTGLLISACHSQRSSAPPVIRHMAQAGWEASASVYADKVPTRVVLQDDGGDSGVTVFYCMRIGLYDSTDNRDEKLEAAITKYYQLDMYKDWVLLHGQDSIKPVFAQPIPKKTGKLVEQMLVFEIPKGFNPDRIVYKDPYKILGNRQTMTIHDNQN